MRVDEIERNTYKNSRPNIFSFKRYKIDKSGAKGQKYNTI
jgi:hypothetical protein